MNPAMEYFKNLLPLKRKDRRISVRTYQGENKRVRKNMKKCELQEALNKDFERLVSALHGNFKGDDE